MPKKSPADTPLMRQYLEIKANHTDAILLYRMGDFYEMFFDDAVVAAEALELTLTSRDKNKEDGVPMAGVPHHAVTGYIRKLLDQGFKVAICDQVEDPKQAKGLVKREVTQVITPGVVVDADHLEAGTNNYLVAVARGKEGFGLAALDLSTFELRVTQVLGVDEARDELARLSPKEVIFAPETESAVKPLREGSQALWQAGDQAFFDEPGQGRGLLLDKAGLAEGTLGLADLPLACVAGAAAVHYAEATQPATGVPRCRLICYRATEHLQLDESTLANLEVFESLMERRLKGSLLWVLDATRTPMGARLLRQILTLPLLDVAAIRRRLDAVEYLVERPSLRDDLQQQLRGIHDLERLTSRTVLKVVHPRELGRLAHSIERLPAVAESLTNSTAANDLAGGLPELLQGPPDLLTDVAELLLKTLVDDPPVITREGGIIRRGFDPDLDKLLDLSQGGKANIAAIEQREREATGISTLKVKYNRVFGYFIEVSRAKSAEVPDSYQRKQTLVNAERFVTQELSEYEAEVLSAEERRVVLEQELFETLRQEVALHGERLGVVAQWVAMLDVLCSMAEVAQTHDYVRPEVDDGEILEVEQGRHPVVERFMPAGQFVPNDFLLDPRGGRLVILTGPNMAGKSTIMRQVALIALMAQAGSFVPAASARVGRVDRIFTRVGASDNLARGESTFMVEMREMATILRNATSRSLIVVDEIGRGTATYDGISIAWAVAEFLHDRVQAKCMFATHYHELCALAEVKAFVQNVNVAVQEWKGRVVFLRKLVPGGSSRSYGIEVARLAGLDRWVVRRARKVLAVLEGDDLATTDPSLPLRSSLPGDRGDQLSLFSPRKAAPPARSPEEDRVLDEVRRLQPERITPLDALNLVARLRDELLSGSPAPDDVSKRTEN